MSEPFNARRLALCAGVIALATACAEPVLGPSASIPAIASLDVKQASGTADISGVWTFHEDATLLLYKFPIGNATAAFRCSSDGTYTFAQSGAAFTGSFDQIGVCTAADGTTLPNNFSDVGVTGTIKGRHLRFADDVGCSFEGTLQGPTLSRLGGAVHCRAGGIFAYHGSWSATR